MNKREKIDTLLKRGWCSQMVANSRYHPNCLSLREALRTCLNVAEMISPVQTWSQTPQGHFRWEAIRIMERRRILREPPLE